MKSFSLLDFSLRFSSLTKICRYVKRLKDRQGDLLNINRQNETYRARFTPFFPVCAVPDLTVFRILGAKRYIESLLVSISISS